MKTKTKQNKLVSLWVSHLILGIANWFRKEDIITHLRAEDLIKSEVFAVLSPLHHPVDSYKHLPPSLHILPINVLLLKVNQGQLTLFTSKSSA